MKACFFAIGLASFSSIGLAEEAYVPGQPLKESYQSYGEDFIFNNCVDCHDSSTKKGDLNLEDLGQLDETNAAIWKAVWAQVALGEMPPKKKNKLSLVEKIQFTDWVIGQLSELMKNKGGFHAHQSPKKGNFVNHDLLFSPLPKGIKIEPTASAKRIWRVTPQEHITRLNELINTEPKFNPKNPGLRARGDAVPTNHGGELKLYFGTDRIIKWDGGTVAYATAVKSIPVVLSTMRKHGFANYPHQYTVNSAESTQILSKAADIVEYMAYGPLSLVSDPAQITDNPKTYEAVKPKGDLRGLPSAIVYNTKVVRPLTPVYELFKDLEKPPAEKDVREAIAYLFEMLTFRPPRKDEVDAYHKIVKTTVSKLGQKEGLVMGLTAIFLDQDALFRTELARGTKLDKHGRSMLQDWELGLAVNHAFSYIKPDETLRKAIVSGKMRTREDVKREVVRMLEDDSFRKPRILQFFREYFDYDLAGYICKDSNALSAAGVRMNAAAYHKALFEASASTDRLVELVLEEDKETLKTLLTTQKVVASRSDSTFFGRLRSKEEIKQEQAKAEPKAQEKVKIQKLTAEIDKLTARQKDKITKKAEKKKLIKQINKLKAQRNALTKKNRRGASIAVAPAKLDGPEIFARVGRKSFGNGSLAPQRVLATVPEGQRLGILTHPSWLISHSDAMDNHAIHRGIWIRERLLGGGIPDVPITVDAQLPDEPGTTLRSRMRVTQEKYCWSCHEKMDPLGLTFEMYNHAGLYREFEHGKPVDISGEIIDSGDPKLDGPVSGAIELINKLANSERVEQVFVRHAFRFWMGRNETIHDGPVLRDAHKAYRESGGSMKALLTSLLSSDAFLYRK